MQQGRLEGKVQLLARLLTLRFGELPAWVAELLARADESRVGVWTEAVLSADSVDAVFASDRH